MTQLTRRTMMALSSSAAISAAAGSRARATATASAQVARWDIFELTLPGPTTGNPFRDVTLAATFTQGARQVQVAGFYDGEGIYKLRFSPDALGEWRYLTASSAPALAGKSGAVTCTAPKRGVHGPVEVRNGHHFGHADGTPYYPFGTTCYAWVHQSETLQQQTLASLAKSPFNKIRMCVFPKWYEYNHAEPALYPFERDAAGKNDFTRPNPAFFRHLEQRVADLRDIGVQADVILFHPYDNWGFSNMPAEDDDAYLRYVIARLSSYRNIWWSMANEYDLIKTKTTADFDRFFHITQQSDPYGRLRSVHYSKTVYDYAQPWVTHASLQTADFEKTPDRLAMWKKPVVYDEVQYEGNLDRRWGNLSGQEMTWRVWRGVIAGGYVTHGETMLADKDIFNDVGTPTLWWAHGGQLHGTSPERIGFLRSLIEGMSPGAPATAGLEADATNYYTNAHSLAADGKTVTAILYFTDYHQPIWYEFPLPQGTFKAELIDPWAMTITPVEGTVSGKARMRLSGAPYQAVRFTAV